MKRILPILLCCVLLIGVIAVPAMAATSDKKVVSLFPFFERTSSYSKDGSDDVVFSYLFPPVDDVRWTVFDTTAMRGYNFTGKSFRLHQQSANGESYKLTNFGIVCQPYADNLYFSLETVDLGGFVKSAPHVYLDSHSSYFDTYTIDKAVLGITFYDSDFHYCGSQNIPLKYENFIGDVKPLQFDQKDNTGSEYRLQSDYDLIVAPSDAVYFQFKYDFSYVHFADYPINILDFSTIGLGDRSYLYFKTNLAWVITNWDRWTFDGTLPPEFDSIEAYLDLEKSIWDRMDSSLKEAIQTQNNAVADLMVGAGGFYFLASAINYVFDEISFLQSLGVISFALGIISVLLSIFLSVSGRIGIRIKRDNPKVTSSPKSSGKK